MFLHTLTGCDRVTTRFHQYSVEFSATVPALVAPASVPVLLLAIRLYFGTAPGREAGALPISLKRRGPTWRPQEYVTIIRKYCTKWWQGALVESDLRHCIISCYGVVPLCLSMSVRG